MIMSHSPTSLQIERQSTKVSARRSGAERGRAEATEEATTPSQLEAPAFLMNFPFSYTTTVPNNVWMQELPSGERPVHTKKAQRQFLALYHFLASRSLVVNLPTPAHCNLQDLVFTANLGIVLHHLKDQNHVVLSNFASPPRRGEESVGESFFRAMGYQTHMAPSFFEGEAELKHLHDNVYIGGYGERSTVAAYEWMETEFDMKIIKVHETDPYLYHLDCTVFPLTREKTLVCTEMYTPAEIAAIERETEIVDVSRRECLPGICNSIRLANTLVNASNIFEIPRGSEKYEMERDKNRRLQDLGADNGFEVSFFNISEFLKGGAVLSCMLMHLNRSSYNYQLL
jgi:N-dimethylarginine dimethylaminohydrolase